MSLKDMMLNEETRSELVSAPARRFLHGCVRTEDGADGFVRPWRIGSEQLRILGSCMAWHPGLFKQMARTTAGVTLRIRTDSMEIGVEIRCDEEPRGTREVLMDIDGTDPEGWLPHDGLGCLCDGRRLAFVPASSGPAFASWFLDADDVHPGWHLQRLPGFGPEHAVEIWLPALRGCCVGHIWGDGTYLEPVEAKRELLVLGDSLAQGFVAEDPSRSWVGLLADKWGMEALNQGIGGQVFQPQFLEGMPKEVAPAAIVVEYGANYRYEGYAASRLERDVHGFLAGIRKLWPEVSCYVITTMPASMERYPTHPASCYGEVPQVLAKEAGRFPGMEIVSGAHLVDPGRESFADGDGHLTAASQRRLADRIWLLLHPETRSQEELSAAAAKLLAKAPRAAFPLREAARHGKARWLFVDEGCILCSYPSGSQVAYAADPELGRNVLALMGSRTELCLIGSGLEGFAQEELGLADASPLHLAVYKGKRRIKVPVRYLIEPIGPERTDDAMALIEGKGSISREEMEVRLAQGSFLGGFDDGKLIGFIGLAEDGSIGTLEVDPASRRRGWASALEGTLVNHLLKAGEVPWAMVEAKNKPSLRLHSKLGFEVGPAGGLCRLRAPRR